MVVNVPAHRWLWSASDEELGHFRRYTMRSLESELRAAGLRPVLVTHVFSWLVPMVALERLVLNRGRPSTGLSADSPLIASIAIVLTGLERALVGRLSMRLGTSVLAVATPDT